MNKNTILKTRKMNKTNTELPQGVKDTLSILIAIIITSLIGGLLYFIYKKIYKYNIFEAMPDNNDNTFQKNLCIFVFAVFIISTIIIAIFGLWLSFSIMFLILVSYLSLGTIFYSFHTCIIINIQNR